MSEREAEIQRIEGPLSLSQASKETLSLFSTAHICEHLQEEETATSSEGTLISHYQIQRHLTRGGRPFRARGVTYGTFAPRSDGALMRNMNVGN